MLPSSACSWLIKQSLHAIWGTIGLLSISQCTVQLINSVRVIRPGAKQHIKLDNYCKIQQLAQECGAAAVVQDGYHFSSKEIKNGEDKVFKFID